MFFKRFSFIMLAVVLASGALKADLTQVGELRIGNAVYSADTYFDPGFTDLQTRNVADAPFQITSLFSGTSSEINSNVENDKDIGLRTYSVSTNILQINRYGGTTHPGMVQWKIDLTPLETYLSDGMLSPTDVLLRLVTSVSDAGKPYDVYLSYDNPAEGIALTDISPDDSALNGSNFFLPAQTGENGDIVNGAIKILAKQYTGDMDLSTNLLDQYSSGVRVFNLIITSNAYMKGRKINIQAGSGIYFDAIKGASHTPTPTGSNVDSTTVTSVSWLSPEQDDNGGARDDPNIASIDSYDVYWSDSDPNFTGKSPVSDYNFASDGTVYSPTGGLSPETTYYWRVDTHITWDDNSQSVVQGSIWQFTTAPVYFPPVVTVEGNVTTTLDILPATITTTVTGNSDPITSTTYEVLMDDFEYPEGAVTSIETPTATEPGVLTANFTTTMAGTYKVKLVVSDGITTIEKIIGIKVFADGCEAQKASASGWTANYFDIDQNCVVDLNDFAAFAAQWLNYTGMVNQDTLIENIYYLDLDQFIEGEDVSNPTDPNFVSNAPLEIGGFGRPRITPDLAQHGGYYLGYTDPGTYATYAMDIPQAGSYTVYLGYSYPSQTIVPIASFGTASEPAKYGTVELHDGLTWNQYQVATGTLNFDTPGPHLVRLTWVDSAFNVDFIGLKKD